MKSRYPILLVLYLSFLIGVQGALIDTSEFEPSIGSVYYYRGVISGSSGESVITHLDGSSVFPGSLLAVNELVSTHPDGNLTTSSFSKDGALLRQIVNNQHGTFEMNYNPPWRLVPRFATVGQSYESNANFTYWVSDILVNGSSFAEGRIEGTETITVPVGEFEALKASVDIILGFLIIP